MASNVLQKVFSLCRVVLDVQKARILERIGARLPLPLLPIELPSTSTVSPTAQHDLLDWNGILNAAPKRRRTIEKRRTASFGYLKKMENAEKKKNIVACRTCGNWHEDHTICGHCYDKVKAKTAEMQAGLAKDDAYYFGQDSLSIAAQLHQTNKQKDAHPSDVDPTEQMLWWHENLKKKVPK